MSSIPQIYENYYVEYTRKYGSKTIVLMELGGFLEICALDRKAPQLSVCYDLDLAIASRGGNTTSFMAGFPSGAVNKYVQKLNSLGYTTVLVTQVSDPPNVRREVSSIISPGCVFSESDDSNVASVVISFSSNEVEGSITWVDVNMGTTMVESITSSSVQNKSTFSSVATRCRNVVSKIVPNEVVVTLCDDGNTISYDDIELCTHLGLSTYKTHIYHKKLCNTREMRERINDTYKSNGYSTAYDAFSYQQFDETALMSIICLMDFLSDHSPYFVRNMRLPTWNTVSDSSVRLYNGVLEKLDVLGSFQKLANKCVSAQGKREWRRRLMKPTTDPVELRRRYDAVECYNIETLDEVIRQFEIPDISRLQRRCMLQRASPRDVYKITRAIEKIVHIYSNVVPKHLQELVSSDDIHELEKLLRCISSTFDLSVCASTNSSEFGIDLAQFLGCSTTRASIPNLFHPGVNQELDSLSEKLKSHRNYFEEIRSLCELIFEDASTSLKKSNSQKSIDVHNWSEYWSRINTRIDVYDTSHKFTMKENGCHFYVESTKTKVKLVESFLSKATHIPKRLQILNVSYTASVGRISFYEFPERSDECNKILICISRECKRQFNENISNMFQDTDMVKFDRVLCWTVNCEIACSTAIVSRDHKWSRPCVNEDKNQCGHGRVCATGLRHPVLETIVREDKGAKYVENDIALSGESSYILFGVNSSGKSTLLKSVALAVVAAQSGLFVAASSFDLSPYYKILCRMGNDDDMLRQHSSFTKEMLETGVLWHTGASPGALIIADELCASTEYTSALGIVSTVVDKLASSHASFLFSTHLIELGRHETVKRHKNVNIAHMTVNESSRDDTDIGLIFDRTLALGLPQVDNYGSLVAKRIINDPEFSSMMDLLSKKSKQKYSRYNSKLKVKSCSICGYYPKTLNERDLETHHVDFQCNADKYGFHGVVHKDSHSNLVVLCRECHQNVHKNNLFVDIVDTDEGRSVISHDNDTDISDLTPSPPRC